MHEIKLLTTRIRSFHIQPNKSGATMNMKRIFMALSITGIIAAVGNAQPQQKISGWAGLMFRPEQAVGARPAELGITADDQSKSDTALIAQQPNDLTGTWLIGPPGGQFMAVHSFHADGTFAENSLLDFIPPLSTPGRGAWVRTGDREFAVTFFGVIVGTIDKPEFQGTFKARWRVRLNETGEEISGPAKTEIFDAKGKLVAAFDLVGQGKRVHVEPLP